MSFRDLGAILQKRAVCFGALIVIVIIVFGPLCGRIGDVRSSGYEKTKFLKCLPIGKHRHARILYNELGH